MKNNRKGFTLIELLVVIAIIALLSTLAVISLSSAREDARDSKRLADVRAMQSAVELFINQQGVAPAIGTWADLFSATKLGGAGLSTPIQDPGNNEYRYCVDTVNTSRYLLQATMESTPEIDGDLDGTSAGYAGTECRLSDDEQSAPANCDDLATGLSVFCLGILAG